MNDDDSLSRASTDGGAGRSLTKRIEAAFGAGVDPGIRLQQAPDREAAVASTAVLRRLASHSPAESRYRLVGEIARGGMGTIFHAWDEDLRRNLAMKVIQSGGDHEHRTDAVLVRRFLDEAQVTAQLDHPGIVPVHELGVDERGNAFFTMRLVTGQDLRAIFHEVHTGSTEWTVTRALGVILRVCEAMAYAHSRGVLHRDLKPENVMVGRFGETYVMDWGLARVMGRDDRDDVRAASVADGIGRDEREVGDDRRATLAGDVVGTPEYMPPEQAAGRIDEMGPHSDVYSIGAMLYHLLTGHTPYAETHVRPSARTVLARLASGPPPAIQSIKHDVPRELVAICAKAMEWRASDRYPNCDRLADDLRAYLEGRVVKAYETGSIAELRKWVQRNKAVAGVIAAAVVVTAFFIVRLHERGTVALASERRAVDNERIAREEQSRARVAAETAEAERRAAKEQEERVLRLSDLKRLADLKREQESLWPAWPERTAALEAWLARARDLVQRRDEHHRTLIEIEKWGTRGAAGALEFDDTQMAWWHDTLADLVLALDEFAGPDVYGATIASVDQRLARAKEIASRATRDRAAWDEAFAGLEFVPHVAQVGLVPLGADPRSHLLEFADVQTGAIPQRRADGTLAIDSDSAVVFVLIPRGTFSMGAQSADANAPGFVARCESEESPVHEVTLAPFLLSKWEMTQAQWRRLTGKNPSAYAPPQNYGGRDVTPMNPVEQVSHEECVRVLARIGAVLPTEAQWERAARAGTTTSWWTGDAIASLAGAGNLADRFCREHGGPATWSYEDELDDGYMVHAPVGSFAPNAFGLFDVVGNVWEWCRDPMAPYTATPRPGDGLRDAGPDARIRVFRGGAFSITAYHARSSNRGGYTPEYRFNSLGVRPAREWRTP